MKAKQERLVPRQTDESLVERAQAGDKQATEELLSRYAGLVRGRARGFFLVGGETEDLIQEGMIGLYRAVSEYRVDREGGMSFKNFAYLCVSRRIYDALRAAGRPREYGGDPDTLSEGGTPEDTLLAGEMRAELRLRLTGTLSDFEFRVVTLWLEGMSYASIARVTGKDMKSIDNALARSKKKLQKSFLAERQKENG